jgi:hypothetical protein
MVIQVMSIGGPLPADTPAGSCDTGTKTLS